MNVFFSENATHHIGYDAQYYVKIIKTLIFYVGKLTFERKDNLKESSGVKKVKLCNRLMYYE